MLFRRIAIIVAGVSGLFAAAPASAQFFLKSVDLRGAPVTGEEPGMTGPALPGATADELSAALVWNLRAALNVAALQCDFQKSLLTLENYNALLKDHDPELDKAMAVLDKYFERVNKNKKLGQVEADKYGTRIYSGFSTVSGQLSFCQTAASVGQDAIFAPPGGLVMVAKNRMRELRASLAPWGEQILNTHSSYSVMPLPAPPAFGDNKCWKKSQYVAKKCGALTYWR